MRLTFDEAFFGPDNVREPTAPLRLLREQASAHRSDILGGWAVLGWQDARTVLRSRAIGQGDRLASYAANLPPDDRERIHPISEHMDRAISFTDPPQHTMERAAAAQVLDAGLGRRIEPDLRTALAERLEALQEREAFDAIEDFALPLTVAMISAILGVRYEDRDRFVGWVDRIFAYIGSPMDDPDQAEDCMRAYASLGEYVAALMAEARAPGRGEPQSLIELLSRPDSPHGLADRDVLGMTVGMVQGGFETTTTLISNAVAMLLQHPAQRTRIAADPELTATAIEEVVRLAPSLKMVGRQAYADVELSDTTVRAGENVVAVVLAANRDPAVFADPDAFTVERQPNPHLSFGFGTHFCLGGPLARMQARMAVDALLERFPDMALATDDLQWVPSALLRRRVAVPVATRG